MTSRRKPFTVAARVTGKEQALIRAAAADAGVDCSTFIAQAVLDHAKRQLVPVINPGAVTAETAAAVESASER